MINLKYISRELLILVFVMVLNLNSVFAQSKGSSMDLDSIKMDLYNYLVKEGKLEENKDKDYLRINMNVFEIVKKEPLELNKTGVFGFGAAGSPSKLYLLLKDDSDYKIVNVYVLSDALINTITFLKKHNRSSIEIYQYTEEILSIYKRNRYNSKVKL